MQNFNPTETKIFRDRDNGSEIKVHVQNDEVRLAWQLEVNGDKSEPTIHYSVLLVHKGYAIATAYWEGHLQVVPFRVAYCTEVRHLARCKP